MKSALTLASVLMLSSLTSLADGMYIYPVDYTAGMTARDAAMQINDSRLNGKLGGSNGVSRGLRLLSACE